MLDQPEHATVALKEWSLQGGVSPAQWSRVIEHPLFDATARQFMINMASLRKFSSALEGVSKDAGHYVAAMFAIYLHASGGLTMKRLRDFCASTGFLSPGRARAMLIYMQYLRFVELLPTQRGASARFLPTRRFTFEWRHHLRLALLALAPIAPAIMGLLDQFDDPLVFEIFVTAHCEYLMGAAAIPENRCLELERLFLHRRAGHTLVYALTGLDSAFGNVTEYNGPFPSEQGIIISVASLAREFRVSRLHISRILDDGVDAGFLTRDAFGSIAWTAAACAELRRSSAAQITCLLRAAADTVERIGKMPAA